MSFLKRLFGVSSGLPAVADKQISISEHIPEPTRSLIFVTHENPEKATSPFTVTVTISLTEDSIETDTETGHNFYSEPSLIWSQLPIKRNDRLEEEALYFPSYVSLNPEQRYQYVTWLQDITRSTNLSYVFLYYYGLERHLLVGNFALAAEEIIRLLKYHNEGSFRSYAQGALVASILHHQQFDLFDKYSFLSDGVSNEVLIVRRHLGRKLLPKEIIEISSRVGFKNKLYIKKYPDEFLEELTKLVDEHELSNGSLLEFVPFEDLKISEESFFANASLPENVQSVKTPQLLSNKKFSKLLFTLLQETHNRVKINHRKSKTKKSQ